MKCLKVYRRKPVEKKGVENPKGKSGVGLERGTKRKGGHSELRGKQIWITELTMPL